ncbi:hypothetical protein PPEP_a1402 [Pseudoalteromonas peptidolytica F12-50-A1]|uniref:Uncharacterized protein n=1 Tax=Pseudoalteromonas peptidolytica F12-50-A1 TaxID=1315280 RepID=A0A8I0MUX2_9GAMM|nr:hypothetical protein [Pseudoalteromonas peptidolytica F12-50-A1]
MYFLLTTFLIKIKGMLIYYKEGLSLYQPYLVYNLPCDLAAK